MVEKYGFLDPKPSIYQHAVLLEARFMLLQPAANSKIAYIIEALT